MYSTDVQVAKKRLENAPWPSSYTAKAISLLDQAPSEDHLVKTFENRSETPIALEALCALQSDSEHLYDCVCEAIASGPLLSWCMVDSLNHLAWYDGMRAFINPPTELDARCSYPFYILARNKIFYPTDMTGSIFEYHVKGLWAMLEASRSGNWRQMQSNMLAIINMLQMRLNEPTPDAFTIYFSALLLSGFAPLKTSISRLRDLTEESPHPALSGLATLTLRHLTSLHDAHAA